MTGAIINLQTLLVKSYLLNALLLNRKPFPLDTAARRFLRPPATRRDLTGPPRGATSKLTFDDVTARTTRTKGLTGIAGAYGGAGGGSPVERWPGIDRLVVKQKDAVTRRQLACFPFEICQWSGAMMV